MFLILIYHQQFLRKKSYKHLISLQLTDDYDCKQLIITLICVDYYYNIKSDKIHSNPELFHSYQEGLRDYSK